jgi:hypothetical protein
MKTAGNELQVVVLAATRKGDVTLTPFAGVVTVMFDWGGTTVMFRSTSSWTFTPQHFTCRTWLPTLARTVAVKEVDSMMALPSSIE